MSFRNRPLNPLEVELISGEIPEMLRAINDLGIPLHQITRTDELTCRFVMDASGYRIMQPMLEKRGAIVRTGKPGGLRRAMLAVGRHPVLLAGMLVLCLLTMLLPRRILLFSVEGNQQIPRQRILEAAQNHGVSFGALRREISSEEVKNGMLREIPQLQWVGVTTSGCRAAIHVREREVPEPEQIQYPVTRIVAERDGYILSGTVTRGNGLFRVGQSVVQGQPLISGYTDCGFCVRAEQAQGEIFARTNREITLFRDKNCLVRTARLGVKRKISLRFGKKSIILWKDSGISDASCDRMDKEYTLTLPGGFFLPVSLRVETVTYWETAQAEEDPLEAQRQMEAFARRYLHQQMIAGTVRRSDEEFREEPDAFVLRGSYICEEMIGREQPEQIGETNE